MIPLKKILNLDVRKKPYFVNVDTRVCVCVCVCVFVFVILLYKRATLFFGKYIVPFFVSPFLTYDLRKKSKLRRHVCYHD